MGIVTWIIEQVGQHGYLIVAGVVGAESAGVPVPGETALLVAAFAARQGHLDIVWVIAIASIAAIVGDNIGYAIGRRAGRPFLERHGRWLLMTPERIDRSEQFFARHGGKAVFLARWSAGLRVAGAWLAGISHMSWPRFFLWNAAGAFAWALAVGTAGYLLGASYALAEQYLGALSIALIALVVGVLAWRALRRSELRDRIARMRTARRRRAR